MLRHRHNWTRGVAAQHASLSRWRSPVRIRSGPPQPLFPTPRPPARTGRSSFRSALAVAMSTSGTIRPVNQRPLLAALGVFAIAVVLDGACRARRAAAASPGRVARRARPSCDARASPSVAAARRRAPPPSVTARRAAVRHRPRRRRRTPAPVDVAIVPVTNFRATPTSTNAGPRSRPSWPARAAATRRSSSSPPRRTRSSPRSASRGPAVASRLVLAADAPALAADLAKSRKRLAFLRADAVGPRSARWRGADALFGVGRVDDLDRLAAHRRLRRRARRRDAFDPAATWTLFAGGDILLDRGVYKTLVVERQGRRLPVRWRDGRDHQPLLLLVVRLGAAAHEADRQRGRGPRAHRGRRPRHRQLREPGAEPRALAHQGHGLLRGPG